MKYKLNWLGYARVSSTDQHLDRQINALKQAGVAPKNIYKEKVSGATIKKRPKIRQLLKDVNRTNVIAVLAIDRLGRNYKDIKYILRTIKQKGARIVILNLPMSRKYGSDELLGSILNEFVINILAYQADHERKAIRARQAQGIENAKKNGVYKGRETKFGRENKELQGAINDYFNRAQNGMSVQRIADIHGMSRSTLYKKLRKYKPNSYEKQFKLTQS